MLPKRKLPHALREETNIRPGARQAERCNDDRCVLKNTLQKLHCNLNVFDYFPVSVPFLTMVCGMTENPFVVNLELQSNVKLGSYSAFTCHVTIGPV